MTFSKSSVEVISGSINDRKSKSCRDRRMAKGGKLHANRSFYYLKKQIKISIYILFILMAYGYSQASSNHSILGKISGSENGNVELTAEFIKCHKSLLKEFSNYPIVEICSTLSESHSSDFNERDLATLKTYLRAQSPYFLSFKHLDDRMWSARSLQRFAHDLKSERENKTPKSDSSNSLKSLPFEVIGQQYFSVKEGFQRPDKQFVDIMGVSGLFYDQKSNQMYGVSDRKGHPDLYVLNMRRVGDHKFQWYFVDHRSLNHSPNKGPVFTDDLEDIVRLNDGSFLVTSENGDSPIVQLDCRGIPVSQPMNARSVLMFFRGSDADQGGKKNPDKVKRFNWNDYFAINKSFESLAISADGQTIYTAPEAAPIKGPGSNQNGSVPLFALQIQKKNRKASTTNPCQFSYVEFQAPRILGSVPISAEVRAIGGGGISALLRVDDQKFFVMERAYDRKNDKVVGRIFSISLNAIDKNGEFETQTVIDFDDLAKSLAPGFRRMENLEGMTFGPDLRRDRTLVLVSDNNANPAQVTALITLKIASRHLK